MKTETPINTHHSSTFSHPFPEHKKLPFEVLIEVAVDDGIDYWKGNFVEVVEVTAIENSESVHS